MTMITFIVTLEVETKKMRVKGERNLLMEELKHKYKLKI